MHFSIGHVAKLITASVPLLTLNLWGVAMAQNTYSLSTSPTSVTASSTTGVSRDFQNPAFPSLEIASSRSQTVIDKYPVVPNSVSDQLVCYMQTADGRVLDLNRLCGKPSSPKPVPNNSHPGVYICDPLCRP